MKKLILLFLLLCSVSCKIHKHRCSFFIYKQEIATNTFNKPIDNDEINDSITLKLLEVSDVRIFDLIDTVLQASEKCFFVKDNQPVLYVIAMFKYDDTLGIRIRVEQYDKLYYSGRWFDDYEGKKSEPYFFSYKDKYFFVGYARILVSNFFKITDIEKTFNTKFGTITNYYTYYPYISDRCVYDWLYIDGNFYNTLKRDCVSDTTWLNPNINRYKDGKKLSKAKAKRANPATKSK